MEDARPWDLRGVPKESTARATLALVAFTLLSIATGESVWYTVFADEASTTLRRCLSPGGFGAEVSRQLSCQRSMEHDRVLWTLSWGPLALGLALAGALLASAWRRRRMRPVPLDRLPALERLSSEASASVGRDRPLPLLWSPERSISTARADGIVSPYIEVGAPFLGRSLTDPESAGAILRHEYAHHELRDVLPSRMMLAAGYVGLALAVPFIVTIFQVGPLRSVSALTRLALVLGVVAVARAAVLRTREFEADLRAAQAGTIAMRGALGATSSRRQSWLARLSASVAHHPPAEDRRMALDEPWRVFRPVPRDAVLAGLTAGAGAPVLSRLARSWFQGGDPALYAELIGWGTAGLLLGAWFVMVLVRAEIASRATDRSLELGRFSWSLVASLLVAGVVLSRPLYLTVRPLPRTIPGIGTLIMLALGLLIVIQWLRGLVEWWLDTALAQRPRWAQRAPIAVGAAVTGLLLGILASLENSGQSFDIQTGPRDQTVFLTLVSVVAAEWFSLLLVVVAVAVPLALAVMISGRQPGAKAATALKIGVIGAAVSVAAFTLYWHLFDPVTKAVAHGWYSSILTSYASQAIVGGVVAVAASTVPLVVPRAQVLLAGLAAVGGAVPAGIGAWLVMGPKAALLAPTLHDVVLVALLGGLLGASLVRGLRSRQIVMRRWTVVALSASLVSALPLIGLGWASSRARPSLALDNLQSARRLVSLSTSPAFGRLEDGRCGGDVSASAGHDLAALLRQVDAPLNRPGKPENRALHDALRRTVAACADAVGEAQAAGAGSLDPAALERPQVAAERLNRELQLLQARLATS